MKKFTVILLYPDWPCFKWGESFIAYVTAKDSASALILARQEASNDHVFEENELTPIFISEGYLNDLTERQQQ